MNPRNALIFLIAVACITAWWQVETRLTVAQNLNMKLSMEAANLVEIQDEKPPQPEIVPTAPSWEPAAAAPVKSITAPAVPPQD